MNFQIVIMLSVAACALALPLPDEEVSVLQKAADIAKEAATATDELMKKAESSLSTVEEGANAVVSNITATVESIPKLDIESKFAKIADEVKEAVTAVEDEIQEAPKSLPVKAREETEPAVPPFAGVRAEPKELVEIGEAKSTSSSPGAEETKKIDEPKTTSEVKPSTESTITASSEKKTESPAIEEKTEETSQSKPTAKSEVVVENKTDNSVTKTATESPKPSSDSKPTQMPKDKHTHSSEANKSDESAESKESEESNESNKSK